ncbi:hypothetical protein HORIV_64350 [Vreelandella olivaria]|uniref:Uncharacterized protein n=1 Tax=Vreelandella olivaria TaxID=390919 RepID=A0ABM7GTD3_9GAMM|nr:hypothetical protein HORIV_64350 [Halomonas olivaria]
MPEADVSEVQTKILKTLSTWYIDTPQGERNVVAFALKKQDASVLGYWGDAAGDVLFAYASGFVWVLTDAVIPWPPLKAPVPTMAPRYRLQVLRSLLTMA